MITGTAGRCDLHIVCRSNECLGQKPPQNQFSQVLWQADQLHGQAVMDAVKQGSVQKGDVLGVARESGKIQ